MSDNQRVKIVSAGTTVTTRVTVDGVELQRVRSVTWRAALGPDGEQQFCTALVELEDVAGEVEGELIAAAKPESGTAARY
jgi:hypothetical protein